MQNWLVNHLGLSAGGALVLVGLAWQQVLAYVKKTIADELTQIDKIEDPDWKAWAVSTLLLIYKKFPTTGASGAARAITIQFPKLKPLEDSLTVAIQNLEDVVSDDLHKQIQKDAPK